MPPERWHRIETLYHQALARSPEERAAFLDQACGSDRALRLEVESLVANDAGADAFLEEPALAVGARLVADEVAVLTGRQVGPYQVLELLGAGGMGEVYRARDSRLERDVALKMLHGAPDDTRLRRFLDEARAAGALNHPNILAVYDVSTDTETPYIVAELVEGESLRTELSRGPLRLARLLDIATQIADGLTAAHRAAIVHRDLKPENVMITRAGHVKIVDFGLAKPMRAVRDDGMGSLTAPQTIIGTPAYMSPEQARGEHVDFRSDIFSFGAVLYEMGAHRRAFDRRSSVDTLSAILHDEPQPLLELNDQLPRELQRVVERCLAKAPDDRYGATGDLMHDLRWLKDHPAGEQQSSTAAPRSARRVALPIALGLLLAVSAFLVGWTVGGRAVTSTGQEFPSWHKLTFEEGYVHAARFEPGGKSVAYSASWGGKPFQVFSTTTLSPESRALDHLPPAGLLALSPTGQLALTLSCVYLPSNGGCAGTLARAPLLGGAPRKLAENVIAADWGPDDNLAAVVANAAVGYRLEYPLGTPVSSNRVDNVRVSPDGQLLASVERETEGFSVVVRRGQDRRTLSRGWTFISGLAWTVDGSGLFVTGIGPDDSDDAVLRIGIDGRVRRVLRASPRIRVLDAAAPDRLLIDHAWSTRRSAWVHDPAAAGGRRDLTWLGSSTVDALSNDGRTVLITVRTGPTLERGQSAPLYPIYARPTDGREPILLGNGYGRALSADGRWALTITRPIEAGRHSLVLHPLGPGSPRTLDRGVLDLNGRAQNASFAGPDRIVFDAPDETGSMRTYAQSIDGGTPALVAHEPGQVVSPVAPDGERFVSQRRDGSLWIATLTPHDSTRLPFSLQRGQLIRQWSDDGAYLFVVTPLDDRAMLTKVDVKTGTAVPHADIMRDRLAEALRGFDIRISRDGRTIVFSDTRYLSSLFLVEGAR